jgi:hypothetical protein
VQQRRRVFVVRLVALEIGQRRARGCDGERQLLTAEAIERGNVKMFRQQLMCRCQLAGRFIDRRQARRSNRFQPRDESFVGQQRGRQHIFAGLHALQFVEEFGFGIHAVDLSGGKLAGREIDQCQTETALLRFEVGAGVSTHDRRQIIFTLGLQQCIFDDGAGRNHADHVALDELLDLLGVFELLNQRDFVAAIDQLGDVSLHMMMRHTGHRQTKTFCKRA